MRVSEMIGDRGTPELHTVPRRATIIDTIDMMAEHNIGAVVVTDDGTSIDGIISERDMVRHISREMELTLRIPVQELMTRNVTTCTPDDDVDVVIETMVAGHFRHTPVTDQNGSLIGMVSLADLAAARLLDLRDSTQQQSTPIPNS